MEATGRVRQVRAACNGQRVASSGQQAAGGARTAGREQSGVGGGPERPNEFQKFLAARNFLAQISEFIVVPRFCATECWYKICTMFLVPDRAIFAGPGSQELSLIDTNFQLDFTRSRYREF